MKYTFQKIFIVFFCSIFIVIGAMALFYGLRIHPLNIFSLLFGGIFLMVGSIIMVSRLRQIHKFQTRTYAWYKSTYANNGQENKLSCFACGNKKIHVRSLYQRTYHREHFCTQCGKTLYYSPE